MNRCQRADGLLAEVNDFLAGIETVLHTATIDEQIAIEHATETIYGPNEENHYTQLTTTIANLRERLHNHLEN